MDDRTTIPLDAETKVAERPDDHKTELRLWLRLLTCTTLIENEVRRRLRDNFDITLPRFDLLAQLDRTPNGMTLGELSQRMMVSNGNVTGLVDRLHLCGEPMLAPHIDCAHKAGHAHARIDTWEHALPWLLQRIGGEKA